MSKKKKEERRSEQIKGYFFSPLSPSFASLLSSLFPIHTSQTDVWLGSLTCQGGGEKACALQAASVQSNPTQYGSFSNCFFSLNCLFCHSLARGRESFRTLCATGCPNDTLSLDPSRFALICFVQRRCKDTRSEFVYLRHPVRCTVCVCVCECGGFPVLSPFFILLP